MSTNRECLHMIGQLLALGALARTFHHSLGPIRRHNMMSNSCHAYRIQPGAASKVNQPAVRIECRIQDPPHLVSHVLNERVVSPRPIVVRSDAVECVACFVELFQHVVCRLEIRMK